MTAQENFIDHAIQKGESVYSISKKYGVSINAIFEVNPGSKDVIYAGNTLRIPNSNTATSTTNNTVISDTQISNYQVKRGETKSGLSRRFGVSIAMLEQQNPHIVRMLQAGHLINLDKSIKEEERTAKAGEHIVIKGETLWGIARKNGISVAQLEAANSGRLSEFLQIGQILDIPDKNSEITTSGEYIVKRGDTKFQLAKRFNMTIAELENKNPHIVDMLMAGHRLNIDNSNTQENTFNTETSESTLTEAETLSSDENYVNYEIQPQETLYGLARKAGMTIKEFTTLNPELLTSVNKGDIIKMPKNVTQNSLNTEVADNNTQDTTEEIDINKNIALLDNINTEITNGLYFYTPFSSEELGSPEKRDKMVSINTDLQKYIDFFQGAQIAIDSAKALNINFDVTLIKKNIAKPQLSIQSPHKKNAMLVPFLDNASHYPKIDSNEDISIIDIASNINPMDSIKVYKSIPSENFQKVKTLNYLSLQNARTIIVSDLDEARNKNLIINTIPDAKFLKVDNAGFFESNALENTLSKNKLNYIVLDSEKTIVFLNSSTALMSKLSDYKIQLVMLKSSLLPKESEVSDMRYRVLKLIYPTITDPRNKKGVNDFYRSYEDIFGSKPTSSSELGFDVTLDILLRLAQNSSFENTINTITSEHPHLKFDYQKINDFNYSNTGVRLMQYNSNQGIMEID
tara:strand:- start:240 stop:2300 length:2061 start_codon:yes stop_codon:yes gene_type:complete